MYLYIDTHRKSIYLHGKESEDRRWYGLWGANGNLVIFALVFLIRKMYVDSLFFLFTRGNNDHNFSLEKY